MTLDVWEDVKEYELMAPLWRGGRRGESGKYNFKLSEDYIVFCYWIDGLTRVERLSAVVLWWEDEMGLLLCIGGCGGCWSVLRISGLYTVYVLREKLTWCRCGSICVLVGPVFETLWVRFHEVVFRWGRFFLPARVCVFWYVERMAWECMAKI